MLTAHPSTYDMFLFWHFEFFEIKACHLAELSKYDLFESCQVICRRLSHLSHQNFGAASRPLFQLLASLARGCVDFLAKTDTQIHRQIHRQTECTIIYIDNCVCGDGKQVKAHKKFLSDVPQGIYIYKGCSKKTSFFKFCNFDFCFLREKNRDLFLFLRI